MNTKTEKPKNSQNRKTENPNATLVTATEIKSRAVGTSVDTNLLQMFWLLEPI